MQRSPLIFAALVGLILSSSVAPGQEPGLEGRWLVEDIDNAGVIDDLQTTLEVRTGGDVGGNGGCNRYTGSATISDGSIAFGSMATTMMACVPAVMDQEQRYFAALGLVRAWRIDPQTDLLYFANGEGLDIIRLSRMD